MKALSLFIQERLEDGGTGDWFDDLVGNTAGWEGCVAEFQSEGSGLAEVGLVQRVGGRAGIDAPGSYAQGGEGGERPFVRAGYDADFYRAT